MSNNIDRRLNHAGMVGLICELALHLRAGEERDELIDKAEQAINDWCVLTGWTYKRILHRLEVFPPKAKP